MYHTAANVTGVLIARATGMSFGDALHERICEPLGMKDTAFSVAGENISRLATAYQRDDATGEIVVEDGPDGYWSRPPVFEDGGGGLVSTASDYLAFASALLAGICGNMHVRRLLACQIARAITRQPATGAGTGSARETGGHCGIARIPARRRGGACGPLGCLEGLVR
jgi:CubicO group peptidase (beta-lactamase class C family)